jgi:hypothetical protein
MMPEATEQFKRIDFADCPHNPSMVKGIAKRLPQKAGRKQRTA